MKQVKECKFAGSQCKYFGKQINAQYIFCMNANMPLIKTACVLPSQSGEGCSGYEPVDS